MPSLCTKPQENGATPPDTSLQAALAIVEKKVRNLEKRKGKLDAYRDTLQRGKTLNEDQQAAVAKYDEVIGTLEFARELSGQFTKLAIDEAKDKKKMMKKEQQERAKVELIKVNYVLSVREVLSALLEEGVLEDLEAGSNGAPKLSADQLTQLQQFQELATPNREDLTKGSFDKQVAASAEHLVNLAEKKARAVVGTTYQELAQLIDLIRECGYVEAKWANDSTANTENGADDATQDTVEDEEEELVVEEVTELIEDEETPEEVEEPQTNGHYGSADEEEAKANMLGQTMPIPSEPVPVFQNPEVFPNPPQEVHQPLKPVAAPIPVPEPSFNFLQESQIDLESPHMDPAVVMVHPPKRTAVPAQHQGVPPGIPSQTFTNQLFQQSLAGLTPAQQQALLAQQQAIIAQQQAAAAQQQQQQAAANNSQQDYQAIQQQLQQRQAAEKRNNEKFASSYNSAFEQPQAQKVAPGVANCPPAQQPAPFTQQNGSPAAQEQRAAPVEQQPAFSGQAAPMEQRAAAPVDPRAPRVPEGTPQHQEQPQQSSQSQSPQSRPAGYAAAAGGNNKQPDTEIGTWKPEGIQDWNEEEEDNRWGGERGRGRGRGGGRGFGRGNRGYSRGRGDRGGDRGHRGGDRGRGDRKYDDRREDRRDDRKYDDRGDRPRGGYRGRGENGARGGGGYRGRGGAEGGRGGPRGGGQNGYRD